MGDSEIRVALRWLAHPVSLVAIAVMALNDHVLKHSYGTWWTGKLSDVAGLVFFPAVVAVALAAVRPTLATSRPTLAAPAQTPAAPAQTLAAPAQTRDTLARLALAAAAVTGIGFAWVKATAVGAAAASTVLTGITGPLFNGPSVVRADASDLLALPALGIAVWVGLGAAQRDSAARGALGARRTGRARKALTVAAVPIALLASVATGVSENSHARVVTDDAGAWRGQVKDAYNYGGDAYYTRTGAGWELYFEDDAIAPPSDGRQPPVLPDREQTEDCVPADPTVCFRAMAGATGVEASADGGVTWRVDWELSPDQVATLERVYGDPAEDFATHGVGVAEVADGYVVVAGNGTDGFAVRGVDGEWERIGFTGMDCCDWLKTADFGAVDDLPVVHAHPVGLLMGVGLSTLALPFLAAALRWGRRSQFHIGASIAGGFAYVVGAFFGVILLLMNSSYAPLTRAEPGLDMLMFIPLGGIAVAGVVVAVAAWGLFRRGAVLATLGGWLAGAVVAGAAANATEAASVGSVWAQAGVGVVALAALYAVFVPVARRWWVRFPWQGDGPLGGPPGGAAPGPGTPVPNVGQYAVPPSGGPPSGAASDRWSAPSEP
ncbi:MAG: hypothetical protein HGA51_04780 [Demequinaceae bacterium]|nr:hypothetical protein [Demequinaceae bacterium]